MITHFDMSTLGKKQQHIFHQYDVEMFITLPRFSPFKG